MPSMSAPTYDPAAEYVKGVEALNASKFKDAERALGRVVDALPQNAEAWRLLGTVQAENDDHQQAIAAMNRWVG